MAIAGETRLIISLSAISPTFRGTPQEFAAHLVERLKILSPFGIETFVVGDTAPLSNEGPWLKNGKQWWIWDEDSSTYIPLDISASAAPQFIISESKPTEFTIPMWIQFTGTGDDTRFNGLYLTTGTDYVPYLYVPQSGPTADRPTSPVDFQQFYDTDIGCLIWWERSDWRTVSGVPGDTKFVLGGTLTDVLTKNPGWQEIGTFNSAFRGRALVAATKDSSTTFEPTAGITAKAVGDIEGEETHTLTANEIPNHTHDVGTTSGDTGASRFSLSGKQNSSTPAHTFPTAAYGGGAAHNNMQPSANLWLLFKQ